MQLRIAILLLLLLASAMLLGQTTTISGNRTLEGTFTVNSLSGTGLRCVQVDATGKFVAASAACNTAIGGITSINGDTTAAQAIVGGSGISVSTASGTTTITGATGSVVASPQYQVTYYSNPGTDVALDGANGVTVDSTQNILSAIGGITTGSAPPAACNGVTGAICLGQSSSYFTPTAGVCGIQADSVHNGILASCNGAALAALPTSATAPAVISSAGALSVSPGTNSAQGVLQCDGTTTSCSGGVVTSLLSGAGGAFNYFQTPSGACNGSNTTFTLSNVPSPSNSVVLMLNGQVMTPGTGMDFTVSGATITWLSQPCQTGDVLRATYQVALGATYSYFETPTGSINGVNGTFTIAHTPNPTNSVVLMLSGQVLTAGVDYSISTTTITFSATVPRLGDILRATYTY